MTDVVVVGAGPAGATAALTLARRGVRTVLLDRKRFPRDKPCGGGMRRGALTRFPGIMPEVEATVPLHRVHGVLMESPGGARVLARLPQALYLTFRRTEFDAALVRLAVAAGASLVEEARVTGVERRPDGIVVRCLDGRTFPGSVVIAADGINGVVTRAVGLAAGLHDATVAVDTTEETDYARLDLADRDTMYVAYGYKGWPGYGYVFPKATCVDAGVGFLVSFFRAGAEGGPHEHHARFMEEMRAAGVVRGRSDPDHVQAYRLPLGGPIPHTVADRVLVAGDAGGFVNGYSGEGIYYAMVTGEHAGLTAAEAARTGRASAAALAAYERRWRAEIGAELTHSVRIQRRIFARPRVADLIIRAAAHDPRLCRLLALVALGEEDYRRRRPELAWRFLLARARGWVGRLRDLGRAPAGAARGSA